MTALADFLDLFHWQPERKGRLGLELECMVTDGGALVQDGYRRLHHLRTSLPQAFELGYELPAAQLELRSSQPVTRDELQQHVQELTKALCMLEEHSGYVLEVRGYIRNAEPELTNAPEYSDIRALLPHEALVAACSTSGLHVHVGMATLEEALAAYARACGALPELLHAFTSHDRLRAYRAVTPYWEPCAVRSVPELYALAQAQGFATNPKRWWGLIRISRHGTVEFRVADATRDQALIRAYVHACMRACGMS